MSLLLPASDSSDRLQSSYRLDQDGDDDGDSFSSDREDSPPPPVAFGGRPRGGGGGGPRRGQGLTDGAEERLWAGGGGGGGGGGMGDGRGGGGGGGSPQSPGDGDDVIIHMAPKGGKSRWSHIDDLDSFFKKVYRYHQRHGFAVMMTQVREGRGETKSVCWGGRVESSGRGGKQSLSFFFLPSCSVWSLNICLGMPEWRWCGSPLTMYYLWARKVVVQFSLSWDR